jgi:salicylate hydroxylase
MVLLVPDDIPKGQNITEGNVEEMRALYKDWDPRIPKLLSLCESVYKWRLCIRPGMKQWSHSSGAFTMLGDAVHATLPYLASGAGMSLEDGAVLGELFSRVQGRLSLSKKSKLLDIYQKIRAPRTEMVVERGNLQQYLYHLHDGEEQQERDRVMRAGEPGDALAWKDKGFAPGLLGWCCEDEVDKYWPLPEAEEDQRKFVSRL